MGEVRKVRVKVKKRKLKVGRIVITILILLLMALFYLTVRELPINNIYVIGNNIVSDKEILELSNLSDYPSFLQTSNRSIISSIKSNDYIKNVIVKRKFYNKVYLYITEKKVLGIYNDKLLLEDGTITDNIYNISTCPIIISNIDDIKDRFSEKFSLINNDIMLKISEIEYTPNDVDKERFALYMNDGNMVYITLGKITKINKYNSIYSKMEGKKGIIYLDAGDYVEVKE